MKNLLSTATASVFALLLATAACAETPAAAPPATFDAELAAAVGADEHGMRGYVLVILKSGPKPMPKGEARDAMFKGHFANMNRLAAEKKLALAGPLDGVDGWRGLFILAVTDIGEAEKLVATDPVIASGEMVAEYHKYYGSAALMLVNEGHAKVARKAM
ncbi:MAG: YciI family protein [Pseudomarimonas sp.]